MLRIVLLGCVWIASSSRGLCAEFAFHHENVLGTFAEFRIHADTRKQADSAEAAVLAEIDRLSRIYSTYDSKSEVRRWMASQRGSDVSPELFELLKLCDKYQEITDGAFNPRVATATSLWREAEQTQRVPTPDALAQAARRINQPAWKLDHAKGTAQFLGDVETRLSFDAIAKGLIVDKATQTALDQPGVEGITLNIGGDLRVAGSAIQRVSIAATETESFLVGTFRLQNRSVATSGNSHKFFQVDGTQYSHLLDPQTARPAAQSQSVTVIAETATTADVMATALSVFSAQAAIEWCNQRQELECLIVDSDGQSWQSQGWPDGELPRTQFASAKAGAGDWPDKAKLTVSFELNRPTTARYRRPYVAVWIEDKDGFPVRTLVLWLQEGRGARWHRDLKRWYKQDGIRRLVEEKKLIGTISTATRPPGKYKGVWDGKDNQGQLVNQGKYTLYLEAAREHGTYQLIRQELNIGSKELNGTLKGNTEIKSATYEYKP